MGDAWLQDRPGGSEASGAGTTVRGRRPDRTAYARVIAFNRGWQGEGPRGNCNAASGWPGIRLMLAAPG
eukprot:649784-Alexandrium_andersonii.AAC.1